MKKQTKLIPALIALFVVAALMGGLHLASRPSPAAGQKSIEVIVVHSDKSERTFHYETDAQFLGPVLMEDGLVKGEDGPYGLYIKEVDGEVADFAENGAYWALYEGEEYATTGIDTTVIEDGDRYSLVYTLG